MVSGISKSNTFAMQTFNNVYVGANTDGKSGLSKTELLNFYESEGNKNDSAFALMLSEDFDDIDTNADGKITKNETEVYLKSANSKTSPQGTDMSAKSQASSLLDLFLENYAARYDKDCESKSKFKEMLKTLISKADQDGDGGLSMKELQSINTEDDKNVKKMVNALISKFNSLDKNSDGVLSLTEMEGIMEKDFSIEELAKMAASLSKSDEETNQTIAYSSEAYIQKLINNYKNN